MNPFDLVKFAAPLIYRISDKFFKIISWLIILVAIRYAQKISSSDVLIWIDWIATSLIGSVVILQAMYIAVRDPSEYGVPKEGHTASRVVQFVVGLGFAVLVSSPALYLDQIIAAIAKSRLP